MRKLFSIINDITTYKQVSVNSSQEPTDSQEHTRVDALSDQCTSEEIQVSLSFSKEGNKFFDCKYINKSHFLTFTAFKIMFLLKQTVEHSFRAK